MKVKIVIIKLLCTGEHVTTTAVKEFISVREFSKSANRLM